MRSGLTATTCRRPWSSWRLACLLHRNLVALLWLTAARSGRIEGMLTPETGPEPEPDEQGESHDQELEREPRTQEPEAAIAIASEPIAKRPTSGRVDLGDEPSEGEPEYDIRIHRRQVDKANEHDFYVFVLIFLIAVLLWVSVYIAPPEDSSDGSIVRSSLNAAIPWYVGGALIFQIGAFLHRREV